MRRGCSTPSGRSSKGSVLRAKTQHIGGGDRFGRNAQHIADDPADAGVGAAKRLDGGGVVVRLYFEGDFVLVIEVDDAGVIHKGGEHPGRVDLVGGAAQIGFQTGCR